LGGRGRCRQSQKEFKASLVYTVSSRTTRATQKPYLEEKKKRERPTKQKYIDG
jgi:hypothetical protein